MMDLLDMLKRANTRREQPGGHMKAGLVEITDTERPLRVNMRFLDGTCAVQINATVIDVTTCRMYHSVIGPAEYYPAPFESFAADFERVQNIVEGKAMPKDIPEIYGPLTGLTPEILHKAVAALSTYVQSNELDDKYREALDITFDRVIEPELPYHHDSGLMPKQKKDERELAHKAFSRSVQSAFANMRKYGRSSKFPKAKSGKPKGTVKWQKESDEN